MPRRLNLALSLACATVWLLALLPRVDSAYAASFTVVTTADSPHTSPIDGTCASQLPGNPCTLRAAIQAANFLRGGPHRIELLPGTYQLTVAGAGDAASGALAIDADVLIVHTSGNTGEPSVVVDGNGTDRVLDVGPRAVAEVTLVGVVVQNGSPGPTAEGGGVQVRAGSTLSMTNGAIRNSRAANGGGIVNDGTLTLSNANVTGNAATRDGGRSPAAQRRQQPRSAAGSPAGQRRAHADPGVPARQPGRRRGPCCPLPAPFRRPARHQPLARRALRRRGVPDRPLKRSRPS